METAGNVPRGGSMVNRTIVPITVVIILILIPLLLGFSPVRAAEIPEALELTGGDDGSVWERVNQPGFGSDNNMSVVAMAEYQERLYAMTRNEVAGVEVWRTAGSGWEQVLFPGGSTNGLYGNTWINNLWGAMSVFAGKLYCGFSSGLQGSVLKSTGCEIWRYDGANWEPVISDKKDTEESGFIEIITGCAEDDGDITAQFTDTTKAWTADQWAGGVLQITSGEGSYRRFDIISNTSDTLTVQQNEVAGNVGSEYTICGMQEYSNGFPPYTYELGEIQAGDGYEIGTGNDENGFGDYWNKTITKMYLFNNGLYVSTGLNYEYGAQVWYTEDGNNWTVIEPANSFGNYHVDPGYPDGQKPVSTSIGSLSASSVSGSEVLYAGGAGASGSAGMCARMAKLTPSGWELIVDANVDENDTGSNENGFGDGMGCSLTNGNFLPWDLASFSNKLIAGIQSLGGARVLYSLNGSSEDGSWFYSVGGDGLLPAGFDGAVNGGTPTIYQNVAVNLSPFGGYLYAGLVATYAPASGATEEFLTGSHIWKSSDAISWEQVTVNGFGDNHVVGFEAFTTFDNTLYVSASKGASSSVEGLGGAKLYRLISGPPDDVDADGVLNSTDNCPQKPNGPELGICRVGTMQDPCRSNSDCEAGAFCSMNQEDTDGDGLGDICEALPPSYPPLPEALDAMVSDGMVTVRTVEVEAWEEESNYYYAFEPNTVDPNVGFIIYPGGLVDPRSYAPPARAIAEEGYLTVIVKMPNDLAAIGWRRAHEIIDAYPGIERWIIGGHSLGGSFSCAYAKEFTDKVAGVILWASWPSVNFRFGATALKAISIYGTNDGHPDSILAGAEHLPADAEFVQIEGGNHTQFGYYDTSPAPHQDGDNPADITREEQQEIIIQSTVDFLAQFTVSPPTAAIPTLSEWGMIIFLTIILVIGVATLLRKRMV
jgi:hypothetical protein